MGARREARIFRVVREFRAALAAGEQDALRTLLGAYRQAERETARSLAALLVQLPDEGGVKEWQEAQRRLRQLQQQIQAQVAALQKLTGEETIAAQRSAALLAQQHAEALVRATPGAATLEVVWNHLPAEAIEQMVGALRPGSPLEKLLRGLGDTVLARVEQELTVGIALGRNPRVVAERMVSAGRLYYACAERIARTEMLRVYRETTRLSYLANATVVTGWIWYSALDRRTCPACWAMHGTLHTLDETLDDHPNGRCVMVPVTRAWSEMGLAVPESGVYVEPGADVFARQSEEVQRAVLGDSAYAAWREGRVQLAQFVGRRYSPDWGSMRYARSLRSIVRGLG